MKNMGWAVCGWLLAGCGLAAWAEPPAPPSTEAAASAAPDRARAARGVVEWGVPDPTPPDLTPRRARARRAEPERARTPGAASGEALANLRALAFAPDEVRLRFSGGEERSVKAGDALAGGVVRAAGDGLLVVERPAPAGVSGGASTVVLRFDPQGQPRIEVYHHANPLPVEPRPVQ